MFACVAQVGILVMSHPVIMSKALPERLHLEKTSLWQFDSVPPPGLEHAVLKKRLSSATMHSKPLERAEGFFRCENGGSENSAWGKQAVASILKAPPSPPHPASTPLNGAASVGMFFIRSGVFTRLKPLYECVSASERERSKAQESIYL